jgi:hypothetical protein
MGLVAGLHRAAVVANRERKPNADRLDKEAHQHMVWHRP